jgi:hypothetical protein
MNASAEDHAERNAMTQLVKYEAARAALAAAHRIDEVKDIRDRAQALAAYARQARDTEMIEWATEIKVRAERRCGQMLKETAARGERATKKGNVNQYSRVSHDGRPSLSDLGLNFNQSSRYQKLAEIPEEQFEKMLDFSKANSGQVTTAAMLRLGEKLTELEETRREVSEFERAARWRVLRSRLDGVCRALKDVRLEDTPPCPNRERGEILILWRQLTEFMEGGF